MRGDMMTEYQKHVTDTFSRPLRDLRISVIDQCNFRCQYCMPAEIFGPDFVFLPKERLLSFDEITRLVKVFSSLGVEKIRITGGEPLLRKDLPQLIEKIIQVKGIEDIALTTNGTLLGKYATSLKEAGLQRINVSLDSLHDETFRKMNGRGFPVAAILKGIDIAASVGLEVKINMVVQKGMNDEDVLPMAKYFYEKGHTLRFIEYMDVGNTNGWKLDHVFSNQEILRIIDAEIPLEPVSPNYVGEVAKRYRYIGTNKEIGFISSVTQAFCSTCNRARISADGSLYTCLFASQGHSLREKLREEHLTDEELREYISERWSRREDQYSVKRMSYRSDQHFKKIEMSYIGG